MLFLATTILAALAPLVHGNCGFCPGGYAPENIENRMTSTMTCGDIHQQLTVLGSNSDECVVAQASLIVANYPSQCGYCKMPQNTTKCTLCPDGSIPSADAGKVSWTGSTCGQLAYSALFSGADSEQCRELQSTVGSDCGCSPAGARCSICQIGTPPFEPKAFSNTFNMTCIDVNDYAKNVLEHTEDCLTFRKTGEQECGCPLIAEPVITETSHPTARTTFPTASTHLPTSIPVAGPTFLPTVLTSQPTDTKATIATATSTPSLQPTDIMSSAPTGTPTANSNYNIQKLEKTVSGASNRDSVAMRMMFPLTLAAFL